LLAPIYGSEKVLIGQLALQGKYMHARECLFAQRIHAEASSSLEGAAAEQLFIAQGSRNSFLRTRRLLLKAHCRAVRTSGLSCWDKLKCYGVVLRYMLQLRKWGKLVRKLVQGGGVGGDGRRMLAARRPRANASRWSIDNEPARHESARHESARQGKGGAGGERPADKRA
jgi:hypothetical protein